MRVELGVLIALSVAATMACGGAEDERPLWSAPVRDAGSAGAVSPDAQASQASEAPAADAAPVPATVDPFALPVTKAAAKPALTSQQRHQAKGVNPQNPSRQSCLDAQCHAGGSTRFAFAVTVCADVKCKAYASDVEVRVATADGQVYQAFTGSDGNAWFEGADALKGPAWAAYSIGGKVKRMKTPLFDSTHAGSCNLQGCHGVDPPPRNVVLTTP